MIWQIHDAVGCDVAKYVWTGRPKTLFDILTRHQVCQRGSWSEKLTWQRMTCWSHFDDTCDANGNTGTLRYKVKITRLLTKAGIIITLTKMGSPASLLFLSSRSSTICRGHILKEKLRYRVSSSKVSMSLDALILTIRESITIRESPCMIIVLRFH